MKIIANYTRHTALSVLLVAGLGLSGCVPLPYMPAQVPQADPMQAPMQGQQYRPQAARQMQQAPSRGQNIQGALGRPIAASQVQQGAVSRQVIPSVQASAQRTAQAQRAQTQVIPMLRPALQPAQRPVVQRQAMAPRINASTATRSARPSASVSRPATTSRQRKKSQPVTRTRKVSPAKKTVRRVAAPVQKKVVRSAPAPVLQKAARPSASVQTKVQTQTPAPVKQEVAKEVLDMSKAQAKPTASVKTVKQLPPLPPLPATRGNRNSPAVSILVKQANNALSAGKNGRAAATLERALRISPDNATLWLRLAEVNAQQGRKAQAASMAKKAIGLAAGDESLKQRGQRLLN